jgi:hypothetical protein
VAFGFEVEYEVRSPRPKRMCKGEEDRCLTRPLSANYKACMTTLRFVVLCRLDEIRSKRPNLILRSYITQIELLKQALG